MARSTGESCVSLRSRQGVSARFQLSLLLDGAVQQRGEIGAVGALEPLGASICGYVGRRLPGKQP